jgi:release factor glutamine methyltransferase
MLTHGGKAVVEDVVLRAFSLKDRALDLYVSPEHLFVPNAVSRLFSKIVEIAEGDTVFDIGTGTGVLAVWAALQPCRRVWAVDPVREHCELASLNAQRYDVDHKLQALQGSLFDPLPDGLAADVIIGDVSGIADAPGRALGWYSSDVPAGGGDGTEVIVELLHQAPRRLRAGGRLYFPVAVGLSDDEKITAAAEACFESLVRKVDVWFPLSEEEYDTVKCCLPPSLLAKLRQRGSRMAWNGHIYEATHPRS